MSGYGLIDPPSRSTCGITVLIVENKVCRPSSNPEQGSLHFISCYCHWSKA